MDNSINITNLPKESLKSLGIDEKMLESMPAEVKQALMAGGVTPLLQAKIKLGEKAELHLPVKLRVTADKDGNGRLIMYTAQTKIKNEFGLNGKELDAVKRGEVVSKNIVDDGKVKRQLIQLDPELNALMMRDPAKMEIEKRLREFEKVHDITLGQEQRERVKEGKPVELGVGDTKVTVGLDLRTPEGVRFLDNDLKEWERQKLIDYDRSHPEVKGYIMTDENNWEYTQFMKAKYGDQSEQIKAKNDLSNKSGFRL